jgi:1-deoxy-D-xylulose-5-phosphate synthase
LPSGLAPIPLGKAEVVRSGQTCAILVFGTLLNAARLAAETLNATLVDMRFVKPLDTPLLDELALSHTQWVTIEDNAIAGGAGSAVLEYLVQQGHCCSMLQLGLPDRFIEQGDTAVIYAQLGLDEAGILQRIQAHYGIL